MSDEEICVIILVFEAVCEECLVVIVPPHILRPHVQQTSLEQVWHLSSWYNNDPATTCTCASFNIGIAIDPVVVDI
jgi:hypothetical protein